MASDTSPAARGGSRGSDVASASKSRTSAIIGGSQSGCSLLVCLAFLFFATPEVASYNNLMQFRVPQNIAMEDRIAGPLTAIQFGILVVGGLLSFLVFTSTSIPAPINKLIGGLFGLLTVTLAVGKFNDQPMYRFFRFVIAFIISPKTRVWKKAGAEHQLIKQSVHRDTGPVHGQARKVSRDQIASLAAVLDSRGQYGMVPQQETQEKK